MNSELLIKTFNLDYEEVWRKYNTLKHLNNKIMEKNLVCVLIILAFSFILDAYTYAVDEVNTLTVWLIVSVAMPLFLYFYITSYRLSKQSKKLSQEIKYRYWIPVQCGEISSNIVYIMIGNSILIAVIIIYMYVYLKISTLVFVLLMISAPPMPILMIYYLKSIPEKYGCGISKYFGISSTEISKIIPLITNIKQKKIIFSISKEKSYRFKLPYNITLIVWSLSKNITSIQILGIKDDNLNYAFNIAKNIDKYLTQTKINVLLT